MVRYANETRPDSSGHTPGPGHAKERVWPPGRRRDAVVAVAAALAAMATAGALAGLALGLQGPRVVPVPDSDSDSDSEDPNSRRGVIHSGHFMVSSPHSDSPSRRRDQEGPVALADFGPRSIDPTLTRLFECMSLAYR